MKKYLEELRKEFDVRTEKGLYALIEEVSRILVSILEYTHSPSLSSELEIEESGTKYIITASRIEPLKDKGEKR